MQSDESGSSGPAHRPIPLVATATSVAHENFSARLADARAVRKESGAPYAAAIWLHGNSVRLRGAAEAMDVLRIRPERDALGRIAHAARVFLHREGTTPPLGTSDLAFDFAVAVSGPAAEDGFRAYSRGDALRFMDARGKPRRFEVLDLTNGGLLLAAAKSTYLVRGTLLDRRRDSAGKEPSVLSVGLLERPAAPRKPRTGEFLMLPLAPRDGEIVRAAAQTGALISVDGGRIEGTLKAVHGDGIEYAIECTVAQSGPKGVRLAAARLVHFPDTSVADRELASDDALALAWASTAADAAVLGESVLSADAERWGSALSGPEAASLVLVVASARGANALPELVRAACKARRLAVGVASARLARSAGLPAFADLFCDVRQVARDAQCHFFALDQLTDMTRRPRL